MGYTLVYVHASYTINTQSRGCRVKGGVVKCIRKYLHTRIHVVQACKYRTGARAKHAYVREYNPSLRGIRSQPYGAPPIAKITCALLLPTVSAFVLYYNLFLVLFFRMYLPVVFAPMAILCHFRQHRYETQRKYYACFIFLTRRTRITLYRQSRIK